MRGLFKFGLFVVGVFFIGLYLWWRGPLSIVCALVAFYFAIWGVKSKATAAVDRANSSLERSGFNATHRHDNIAINAQDGTVWLREKSGKTTVVHKSDIKSINHTWVSTSRAQAYKNKLEVAINDLDKPIWMVEFERHSEGVIYEGKNHQDAKEWRERLLAL